MKSPSYNHTRNLFSKPPPSSLALEGQTAAFENAVVHISNKRRFHNATVTRHGEPFKAGAWLSID